MIDGKRKDEFMQQMYDRKAVGRRIHQKRIQLGYTQQELAIKINRAYKYYQDIERGVCGMSIETMITLTECLHISLDYLIYGENRNVEDLLENEVCEINKLLEQSDTNKKKKALEIIKIFIETH